MAIFNKLPNKNTTIIYTNYNYESDIIYFLNNNAEVIVKDHKVLLKEVSIPILKEFNLEYLLTKPKLTKLDELKLNILSTLESNKNIFVFLNVLSFLDSSFKIQVLEYLKSHHKIIINYTHDIEETLLLDYLMVIHNNEIIIEGETKLVLKEEKIFKKLGLNLPFIVDLSIGLKYYNLTNKIYYTNESLVNDLWK